MATSIRLAIDVGGTFTDVVALDPDTGELRFEKVLTTAHAPAEGVLSAFDKAEAPPAEVARLNHGTTLGLNALLTRSGARIATIATRGFRDVYLLGRTNRVPMYDIAYRRPAALLERSDTFEVTERALFDGSIETPLDEAEAQALAEQIAAGGYEAVAVAFLHSYAAPDNERRMREILLAAAPGLEVTLSHEVSREYREYERTSTAVLDAYIKPIMRRYLTRLEDDLTARGFAGHFLMSRSGGGAMTVAAAREQPVNLILSGPAGGVVGAAGFARLTGRPNLITIDMGGTSLDASLVHNGELVLYRGAEFEGLPINTPSLYIHTIGAGGGSLGYLDEAGALQVGPESAGAVPGPAAYGRGGRQPTVTDAALVIGYLGTDTPLGGELTLDADSAASALAELAGEVEMTTTDLALGMMRIANTKIVGAVRAISIEIGHDPRDFSLLSFGGGGGLVAVDVARELGIPEVIVPPGQGAFSALGMLMADIQHDFSLTHVQALSRFDAAEAEALFADLESQAAAVLASEGFGPDAQAFLRSIDARYLGQEHAVTVAYPTAAADPRAAIQEVFDDLHARTYGHVMDDPVEITTLRLSAVGLVDKPELPLAAARAPGERLRVRRRRVARLGGRWESYALIAREGLRAGDAVDGPAVITEHTATTVIHTGDRLTVGRYGELIITVGSPEQPTPAKQPAGASEPPVTEELPPVTEEPPTAAGSALRHEHTTTAQKGQ